MIYLQLFYEFFKTGLFAVGGGLATIPFLSAMTDKYTWFTKAQLADMIAVAESTPGPIGVNTATFAGYNAAGIPGAIVATLSLVLPSYIIILAISKALQKFRDNKYVNDAFTGLRPAATGLIGAACYSVTAIALSGQHAFRLYRPQAAHIIRAAACRYKHKAAEGPAPDNIHSHSRRRWHSFQAVKGDICSICI